MYFFKPINWVLILAVGFLVSAIAHGADRSVVFKDGAVDTEAGRFFYNSDGSVSVVSSQGRNFKISAQDWGTFTSFGTSTNHNFRIVSNNTEAIVIQTNQNVEITNGDLLIDKNNVGHSLKIGSANCTTCRLAVAGLIKAEEIQVATGWADYVFESGYNLMALEDVESFVQENGHLPGIPDEETVRSQGVNLGEMTSLLLSKIEELTLHMIELKKDNRRLKDELENLTVSAAQ